MKGVISALTSSTLTGFRAGGGVKSKAGSLKSRKSSGSKKIEYSSPKSRKQIKMYNIFNRYHQDQNQPFHLDVDEDRIGEIQLHLRDRVNMECQPLKQLNVRIQ